MNDVMHRKRARRILGDLKKLVELSYVLPREKTVGFRLLAEARPDGGRGCRWKSQNRKNVYLSPYVEEPLNSKVIKSFLPELRSRYVFFEFRDSYVLYIYVMNILMYISHTSVYHGYGTNVSTFKFHLHDYIHF